MSKENVKKIADLQNEGFEPLTEKQEALVSGGIAIKFIEPCPEHYSRDLNGKCVKTDENLPNNLYLTTDSYA